MSQNCHFGQARAEDGAVAAMDVPIWATTVFEGAIYPIA
jgi:hypothetical protein